MYRTLLNNRKSRLKCLIHTLRLRVESGLNLKGAKTQFFSTCVSANHGDFVVGENKLRSHMFSGKLFW
jgi:hypothetical protein